MNNAGAILKGRVHFFSSVCRRGDRMTSLEAGAWLIVHILQLGLVWRHLVLLMGGNSAKTKKGDLAELLLLR